MHKQTSVPKKKGPLTSNKQPIPIFINLQFPAMYLRPCTSKLSTVGLDCPGPSSTPLHRRFFILRSSLPFQDHKAKYHRELEAAVDVVERACRLSTDVHKSIFSSEGQQVLAKNDKTPVTVADFGVQALISLGLSELFPSIPLVAEEDSAYLRSNNLVDSVVNAVVDNVSSGDEPLTDDDVLKAIDRGGKDAFTFSTKPATYWVLDPIDGTRGFLLGSDALYVVGLALVVEGETVLGVMGCPNWKEDALTAAGSGIIMIAHAGCGTWTKRSSSMQGSTSAETPDCWTRHFVDGCSFVNKATFCIPEGHLWETYPPSALFNATTNAESVGDKEILLLANCCGSLSGYLMVAAGTASAFLSRKRPHKIMKAWDHVVGLICVHEAGGKVTDWKGDELDLGADEVERRNIFPSGGVLVTNGNTHNQILEIISADVSVV